MTQGHFRLGYRPELDGLRGIAVLAVVLFHAVDVLRFRWFTGGFVGVEVFFVLSGFLITTLLLEEWDRRGALNLRHFYLRRACRLLPALALVLAFVGYAGFLVMQRMGNTAAAYRLWEECAGALLYVSNWLLALRILPDHILGPTWTLAIEEQFYLTWPLTLLVLLRRGWSRQRLLGLMLGGFVLVNLWRIGLMLNGAPWIRLEGTDAAAGGLLLGCALALLLSEGMCPIPARRIKTSCLLGFGALLAIITLTPSPNHVPPGLGATLRQLAAAPLADLATAVVLLGLLTISGTPLHYVLRSRVLGWFGRISYGLYLWHFLLLWTWFAPLTPTRFVLWFGFSVGIAAASYYGLERRFVRIGRRFRDPAPAVVPALALATGDD